MPPMWNDEEEPQWGVDTPDTPEVPADAAAAGGAAGEVKEGEAAPADGAAPADAPADPDAVDGSKFNRHWVRPKFLQYSYLYDYRKNYYDDVIDYLNRRSHGLSREIPRPQTWAERVLRTYNQKLGASETSIKSKKDNLLVSKIHTANAIHQYHSRADYHKVFRIAY